MPRCRHTATDWHTRTYVPTVNRSGFWCVSVPRPSQRQPSCHNGGVEYLLHVSRRRLGWTLSVIPLFRLVFILLPHPLPPPTPNPARYPPPPSYPFPLAPFPYPAPPPPPPLFLSFSSPPSQCDRTPALPGLPPLRLANYWSVLYWSGK